MYNRQIKCFVANRSYLLWLGEVSCLNISSHCIWLKVKMNNWPSVQFSLSVCTYCFPHDSLSRTQECVSQQHSSFSFVLHAAFASQRYMLFLLNDTADSTPSPLPHGHWELPFYSVMLSALCPFPHRPTSRASSRNSWKSIISCITTLQIDKSTRKGLLSPFYR